MDILEGPKRMDDARLTRLRKGVHIAMALGMAAVILAFEYWADDSVINLVYKVASSPTVRSSGCLPSGW